MVSRNTASPRAAPPEPRLNLAGALLVAALITSLLAALTGLLARFLPGWRPGYLVAACLLVAIEAALVRYRMQRDRHLIASGLSYLAAELFVLAVLMRSVASLSLGLPSLAASAQLWLRSPLAALDEPFLACLAVGLATALLMRAALRELAELAPSGLSRPADQTIDGDMYRSDVEGRQREAIARISRGLAWGGALALAAIVGQAVSLERIVGPGVPVSPTSGLAGMIYLLCAVTLYSRARLGLLQARWHLDGTEVAPGVRQSWGRASLAIILGVALLTLFLPRSYGLSLLDAMRNSGVVALNLIALLVVNLGLLAVALLGLLVAIPALLLSMLNLGSQGPGALPPVLLSPPPAAPAPEALAQSPPIVPAIIFWACIGLLAAYALWAVARRQAWAARALYGLRAGLFAKVWAALGRIWRGTRGYAQKVSEALGERLRPPPAPAAAPPRLRLRGRSPAALVRYFYLSILRRAAAGGVSRRASQTPYEYGERLRAELPAAAADIAQLTEAYVAATYAAEPLSPDAAAEARGPWQRLRAMLRQQRPGPPT